MGKPLRKEGVSKDPVEQFNKWLKEAISADVPEPNAVVLSTVDRRGRPASRAVLLKGIDNGQFVFYTNIQSKKGQDLGGNPHASLLFVWLPIGRQVRIDGLAHPVEKQVAESYFHSRPRGSKIAARVSAQSQVIESRDWLEQKMSEEESRWIQTDEIPTPESWGGYALEPNQFEFWQGRENRLHDRLLYTRLDDRWQLERLSP